MVGCGSRVEGTDGKNGRWYGVLAVLLLLLSGSRAAGQGGPGGGASAERWRGYLQELVEEAQAESRVPGLVAALVDADETVAVAAGLRAATPAPAVPIESSDRLNLGSCFKSMTATIAARLVEAGTLSWESTFADYFPEYAASMRPEYQAITIPQLLSHRSGITDDLDIYGPAIELIDGTGPQQRSQFMPLAFATHPAGVAGQFQYSNLGYALVGAVIERRTGETFEAVMRRELAMPLGMTSIQFGAPGTNDLMQITQPLGHDENGRPQLPDEQDSPPAIEPAGIYSMTVDDWAKFVRVQFG
ncbi:MAG: beta-lactamase family protein, partial [Planctomycetales bacterium]|nr:beta-lactamase family protein [Planctomycetales bacterium]